MILMSIPGILEARINHLVTKSNKLIEANYKLGVVEQKIILCLASNINPSDSDFQTYKFAIKEFHKLLGLKGTPKYTELRQITKDLMQKVFEIRIDKKVIQVSWLSYVAYNETEGTIDIRFDPFLRPYLLELKREFTSYKLENIVKLNSSYAIRIYELLKQYEKLQERTFLLVDLRKMLGVEDIYPAYGNFKQRVLLPAQKELQKKTDITFKIEEIKIGRRVEKIKFNISSEKKTIGNQGNLEEFNVQNSFSQTVKTLGLSLGVHLSDEVIQSWKKYGETNVITQLEKLQHRKDIENPIGYITKVLNTSGSLEVAASSENETILVHLISDFRSSKEPLPYWLVNEKSVEEIQKWMNLDKGQAVEKFEEIKHDLYKILHIEEPKAQETLDIDFEERKRNLEELLEKLKPSSRIQ